MWENSHAVLQEHLSAGESEPLTAHTGFGADEATEDRFAGEESVARDESLVQPVRRVVEEHGLRVDTGLVAPDGCGAADRWLFDPQPMDIDLVGGEVFTNGHQIDCGHAILTSADPLV